MASSVRERPAFQAIFVGDGAATCLYCGRDDRPVLVPKAMADGSDKPLLGVCEACSTHCRWSWKENRGERPLDPNWDRGSRVETVRVVVPRLRPGSNPRACESYDVLVVGDGDGVDLPGADVEGSETILEAATRALSGAKVFTWSRYLDLLYTERTGRGRLAAVYLCRAWTSGTKQSWKPWPFADLSLPSLYLALRDIWSLILWRHVGGGSSSEISRTLSIFVREGAAKYVSTVLDQRANREVDSSMLDYLRASMTDDEKMVAADLLREAEDEAELAEEEGSSVGKIAGDAGIDQISDGVSDEGGEGSADVAEGEAEDEEEEVEGEEQEDDERSEVENGGVHGGEDDIPFDR